VNFFLNEDMFKMFFGSFTINVVDPQIVFNDGFYDLVDVRIPEGTLLKPKFPAALSGRTHALGRIFDLLGALLGMGAPEQMLNAAGFSDSPHLFYSGYDRRPGKAASGFSCSRSASAVSRTSRRAMARTATACGRVSRMCPTSLSSPTSPAHRALRTIPDSGGAGLHRGGNGLSVAYRFLADGEIGSTTSAG
jgi:N-methylhydantoinase B